MGDNEKREYVFRFINLSDTKLPEFNVFYNVPFADVASR
jgi:hypothetical protein